MKWQIGQAVTVAEYDPDTRTLKPGGQRYVGEVAKTEHTDGADMVAVDVPGFVSCLTFEAANGRPWSGNYSWCLLPADDASHGKRHPRVVLTDGALTERSGTDLSAAASESSPHVIVRFPDGSEASFRPAFGGGQEVRVTFPAGSAFTDCEVAVGPDGNITGFDAGVPHGRGAALLRLGWTYPNWNGEVAKHTWDHGTAPASGEEKKAVKAVLADARRKARDARAAVTQAARGPRPTANR